MPIMTASDLKDFARALLEAGGFGPGEAEEVADLLAWANLRGVDSHGVLRIPRYVEMVEEGVTVPGAGVEVVRRHGAVAVIDGGRCAGATGMNAAVREAVGLARDLGVGWCAARSISHAGAIGYFSSAIAREGLVGIVMTASKPLMSYHGARGEALSTNPLSVAVPVSGADPVVLDMSTAAVALGKVMAARDAGTAIPEGWAVDEDGAATTDPARVAALLPMAGPKGSGLSLVIEILASVLAGNAVIAPVLLGRRKGGFNGLVIAVDPAAFGEPADFTSAVAELGEAIHALPPAKGHDTVLLPGERGAAIARERSQKGIPLAAGTARRLAALAARLGVPVPGSLAAD